MARGGFGDVYEGLEVHLDTPVAIKVLRVPSSFSPDERAIFQQSFRQEAQIMANLRHPSIVRVTGFGIARSPDGREVSWADLGRMAMTFEGWQFKLEFCDMSEEP